MTGQVRMRAARDYVLSYLPGTDPVWLGGETHDERRVDVFQLPPPTDDTLFVLSLRIDDAFVPDVVSTYPHVPYNTAAANARPPRSDEIGVFAWAMPIHSPWAAQARFAWNGRSHTVPVVAGHCLLVAWDTPWVRYDTRPRPEALCIDGGWQPTVSSLVAVTASDFRQAYFAYYDAGPRGDDWAVQAFHETASFAEKLAMVEAILDGPDLSDFAHGCLAAGPVENLIGHDLLDYVAASAERRARWVPLLQGAYWSSEPADVRERLRELLGADAA